MVDLSHALGLTGLEGAKGFNAAVRSVWRLHPLLKHRLRYRIQPVCRVDPAREHLASKRILRPDFWTVG